MKKLMLTKTEIKEETDASFFLYAYAEEEEVENLKELLDDLLVWDADEVCAMLRRFQKILSSPKKWTAWRDEQRRGGFTFEPPSHKPPNLHLVK